MELRFVAMFYSKSVVPNLFDLATPFENITLGLSPGHYLQF